MNTPEELFQHELKDIYDAEKKLVRALDRMAKKSSDSQLASAFQEHRQVTEGQARRLEQVFEAIGRRPSRSPCAGINGLIEEHSSFVAEKPAPEILDLFSVGAAEKVEKYEICAYESLIELGEMLGLSEAVPLLQQNLREEQQTAEKLKKLSQQLGRKVVSLVAA